MYPLSIIIIVFNLCPYCVCCEGRGWWTAVVWVNALCRGGQCMAYRCGGAWCGSGGLGGSDSVLCGDGG